jgi:hypothetical protein
MTHSRTTSETSSSAPPPETIDHRTVPGRDFDPPRAATAPCSTQSTLVCRRPERRPGHQSVHRRDESHVERSRSRTMCAPRRRWQWTRAGPRISVWTVEPVRGGGGVPPGIVQRLSTHKLAHAHPDRSVRRHSTAPPQRPVMSAPSSVARVASGRRVTRGVPHAGRARSGHMRSEDRRAAGLA